MLATTIQITNNPPHTTHTNKHSLAGWLCGQPPPQGAADAHTVLNVNPTVCLLVETSYAQPKKRTHTHHPLSGSKHMQAQENKTPTNPTGLMTACSPQNWAP